MKQALTFGEFKTMHHFSKQSILNFSKLGYFLFFVFLSSLSLPLMATNDTVIVSEIRTKENKNKKNVYVFKGVHLQGDWKTGKTSKKYYANMFLDFGYNRLDKHNMFTGNGDESAGSFPKLRNDKSTSFAIYLMSGRKIAGDLSIMSGIGFDWVNYRFSGNYTIREVNDQFAVLPVEDVFGDFHSLKKTKFMATYLNVPLLLRLNFHKFFIAAGVTGGLNVGSHTTVVYTNIHQHKNKSKNYDVNVATFRYGYTVRAGLRCGISMFTHYFVSPLFPKDEGPLIYPFTIGLSLKL
ncbi:MAG: PorT family protein [Prevotellaceae bacterium]|jgi:hypothetical protein|nr:PorT family protein [Prevotellaceae bacterium]